jgi:transposase
VIDDADTVIWRGRTVSTGEAIGAALKAHAPNAARIGLESGQLAVWLFDQLKSGGFPVICIDARHAKAALSLKVNKTDARAFIRKLCEKARRFVEAWGVEEARSGFVR